MPRFLEAPRVNFSIRLAAAICAEPSLIRKDAVVSLHPKQYKLRARANGDYDKYANLLGSSTLALAAEMCSLPHADSAGTHRQVGILMFFSVVAKVLRLKRWCR